MKRITRTSSHRRAQPTALDHEALRAVTGGADRDPPRDVLYDPGKADPPPVRPVT